MEIRNQILISQMPNETMEDARNRFESDINDIDALKERWNRIRIMEIDNTEIDYDFMKSFESVFRDFSYFWHLTSPITMEKLGEENCLQIMEVATKWKECFWEISDIFIYEELPESVTIYRGGTGSVSDICRGHSWSWQLNVAKRYSDQIDGNVIFSTIDKSDIIHLNGLEQEIIPRKSSLLNSNIKVLTTAGLLKRG